MKLKDIYFWAFSGQVSTKNDFFPALILFLNSKNRKKANEVFKTFWGKKYINKEPFLWFTALKLRNCTVGQPMKFWKKGLFEIVLVSVTKSID